MRRLAAIAIAAAALLAGCGDDGSGGGSTPKETLETLQKAAKGRDGETLCSLFTKKGVEQMEDNRDGEPCPDQVKAGHLSDEDSIAPHTSFTIGEVREEGSEAEVAITFAGDQETVDFVKDGDAWKIDESFP